MDPIYFVQTTFELVVLDNKACPYNLNTLDCFQAEVNWMQSHESVPSPSFNSWAWSRGATSFYDSDKVLILKDEIDCAQHDLVIIDPLPSGVSKND